MQQALKAGWARLNRRIDELAFAEVEDVASRPGPGALLDVYARERSLRNSQTICVLALVFGPPFWIVDRGVFADPRMSLMSALWRLGACVITAVAWLLFAWIKRRGAYQHTYKVLLAWTISAAFIVGLGNGAMGGIELPSFAAMYLLPFLTVPVPCPLRVRLILVPVVAIASQLGVFLPFPEHARHPYILMAPALMVFSVVIALIMGQVVRYLMLQNYLQAQLLADRAQSLEQQVATRTIDIRRLLAHVQEVREEERTLIARELHDDLGQILSALRLQVDQALPDAGRESALAPCHELVNRAGQALRRAVSQLRPLVLDSCGFNQAVLWLLREHGETTGSDCEWSIELDEAQLDEPTRTTLFRILQEALTNAARHAQARRISVLLEEVKENVRMTIRDDGIGFAGEPAGSRRSFGLLGMRERAEMLGGSLHLESSPGSGTTVQVTLPMAKKEAS